MAISPIQHIGILQLDNIHLPGVGACHNTDKVLEVIYQTTWTVPHLLLDTMAALIKVCPHSKNFRVMSSREMVSLLTRVTSEDSRHQFCALQLSTYDMLWHTSLSFSNAVVYADVISAALCPAVPSYHKTEMVLLVFSLSH